MRRRRGNHHLGQVPALPGFLDIDQLAKMPLSGGLHQRGISEQLDQCGRLGASTESYRSKEALNIAAGPNGTEQIFIGRLFFLSLPLGQMFATVRHLRAVVQDRNISRPTLAEATVGLNRHHSQETEKPAWGSLPGSGTQTSSPASRP